MSDAKRGSTVILTAEFTDNDTPPVATNPDNGTVQITIVDPAGTQKVQTIIASANKRAGTTATYDYSYRIPTDGVCGLWKFTWDAGTTVDAIIYYTVEGSGFMVMA